MRSSGRPNRRERARRWKIAVASAVVLVLAAAGAAAYDVWNALDSPSVDAVAEPADVSAEDERRQALVEITVSSDAAFGFAYVDAEGTEERETSDTGGEVTVEVVRRGAGPYFQVWAQSAPTATFVTCRIEVDGQESSAERTEGPGAATYCAA